MDKLQAEVEQLMARLEQVAQQYESESAGKEQTMGDLASQRKLLAEEREAAHKVQLQLQLRTELKTARRNQGETAAELATVGARLEQRQVRPASQHLESSAVGDELWAALAEKDKVIELDAAGLPRHGKESTRSRWCSCGASTPRR